LGVRGRGLRGGVVRLRRLDDGCESGSELI
jgi:hypothetical protein